jgi:hypothetical protein
MLPDTFGFLDKVLIKLRSHFGRSFEHNIRLALAGEVAAQCQTKGALHAIGEQFDLNLVL